MSNPSSLLNRMIRAAKLEVALYEEVEADTKATWQAFQSVVIASFASGLGSAILGLRIEDSPNFLLILVSGVLFTILGWVVWSFLTYLFGSTIFRLPETSTNVGELLRTLGFAISPMVLSLFVFIPFLGGVISVVAFIWFLIAGVIGVRQALDFTTARAIGTCVLALIPYWVLMSLVQWVIL